MCTVVCAVLRAGDGGRPMPSVCRAGCEIVVALNGLVESRYSVTRLRMLQLEVVTNLVGLGRA